MRPICRCTLLFLTFCSAAWAGHARWAVIAAPELRQDGFSDLLTATLSTQDGLELVEREQLELATKELELASCLGPKDAAKRLKLGQVLKADSLALLSVVEHEKKKFLKLTVSDCVQGARLRVEHFAYTPERRDAVSKECAATIQETRERFAGGIKQVVGVTNFLSKNLTHNYDHLQSGFAALLASSLGEFPGVAVLEIEEARAISQELNLTAAELQQRVVPLFVEGEFEMTVPPGETEPLVRIAVRVLDGTEVKRKGERTGLTLDKVTDLLSKQLPPRLLSLADEPRAGLNREQQFAAITARADAFAALGGYEQATALREAALLLQPNEDVQRMTAAVEYFDWLRIRLGNYAANLGVEYRDLLRRGGTPEQGRVLKERYFRLTWEPTAPMFRHMTELVQRRAVNPREACLLISNGIRLVGLGPANLASRHVQRRQAIEAELAAMVAVLPQLDPQLRQGKLALPLRRIPPMVGEQLTAGATYGENSWTVDQQRMRWPGVIIEAYCFQLPSIGKPDSDGSPDSLWDDSSTLPCLERFLLQLPQEGEPLPAMAPLLFTGFRPDAVNLQGLPRTDLKAFYERLRASDQPLNQFYGRCGLLERQWAATGKLEPTQLRELAELNAFVEERCRQSPVAAEVLAKYREGFARLTKPAGTTATFPAASNDWLPKPAAGKAYPLTRSPIPEIDPQCRVTFEPIRLNLPVDAWQLLRGDGFDVLWSPVAVYVLRQPHIVEKILSGADRLWFHSVVTDGRDIWVATSNAGVWVVSPTGEVRHKFDAAEGLPEYDSETVVPLYRLYSRETIFGLGKKIMHLHPVGAGKCVAVGVYGPQFRRWLACLTLPANALPANAGRDRPVHVFHTASNVDERVDSIDSTFDPLWFAEYSGLSPTTRNEPRQLLVGRRPHPTELGKGRTPLAINLDTWAVSLFPMKVVAFSADHSPPTFAGGQVLLPGGLMIHALQPAAEMSESTWTRKVLVQPDRAETSEGWLKPLLLPHGDRWLNPGVRWRSVDAKTSAVETLTPRYLPLQNRYQHFAVTTFHGLVAWNTGDQLYKVHLRDAAAPAGPPADFRDAYVPEAERERHRAAAEQIRKLGGDVDGYWMGHPRRMTILEPGWQTFVYLPPTWRGGDDGLALLNDLYHVGELYLVQAPVGDAAMRHVGQLKTLTALYLEETNVTNAGVGPLAQLSELRYCRLESAAGNAAPLGDAALEPLRSLRNLSALTLYGRGFTDEGLAKLKDVPALLELLLLDCATTHECLESLRRAQPKLQKHPNALRMLQAGTNTY